MKTLITKYWWIWGVALALLGVNWLSSGQAGGQPLVFQSDVGTLVPYEVAQRPITIENHGRRAVGIKNVRTCCGITLPHGFPKEVRGKSTMAMIVDISASTEPLEKTITLETDDPTHPFVECTIRGKPDLSAPHAAKRVILGKVSAGQMLPLRWQIVKANGPAMTCSVVASSPHIIPVVQGADRDGNVGVDIQIGKDAPRGKLVWHMFATTGVQARPILSAEFEADVERGVRACPENIFFGQVEGEATVTRRIQLEVLEPQWNDLEVEGSVESCLESQVTRTGPNSYTLEVSLNPVKMPQILKSALVLHNGSGDRVQIPVVGARKVPLQANVARVP